MTEVIYEFDPIEFYYEIAASFLTAWEFYITLIGVVIIIAFFIKMIKRFR